MTDRLTDIYTVTDATPMVQSQLVAGRALCTCNSFRKTNGYLRLQSKLNDLCNYPLLQRRYGVSVQST